MASISVKSLLLFFSFFSFLLFETNGQCTYNCGYKFNFGNFSVVNASVSTWNVSSLFDGNTTGGTIKPGNSGSYIYMYLSNYLYLQYIKFYQGNSNPNQIITCTINSAIESLIKESSGIYSTNSSENLNYWTNFVSCSLSVYGTSTLYEIELYGSSSSPSPTSYPTMSPTPPTNPPTVYPTRVPTRIPTNQPTRFPTPHVCDDKYITQDCCGEVGYKVLDDQVYVSNSRFTNPTSCIQTYVADCCGDTIDDMRASGTEATFKYYCVDNSTLDVCSISFYDTATINGTLLNGTLNYTTYNYVNNQAGNATICKCKYTINVCEGTDEAICGNSEYFNVSTSPYYNQTWQWYNLSSWYNTTWNNLYLNANGLTLDDYDFVLWDECGYDSFVGNVSQIFSSNLSISGDQCTCSYHIQVCKILPDTDLYSETCKNQSSPISCCNGGNYTVNNQTWEFACVNQTYDTICPDIYDNKYFYTSDSKVEYYVNNGTIYSECSCRYEFDTCVFPTMVPTIVPTTIPTLSPSKQPTPSPTPSNTTTPPPTKSAAEKIAATNAFTIGSVKITYMILGIVIGCFVLLILSLCILACYKRRTACFTEKKIRKKKTKKATEFQMDSNLTAMTTMSTAPTTTGLASAEEEIIDPNEPTYPQWAQCQECARWRIVRVRASKIETWTQPPNWQCKMGINSQYASCEAPQESPDQNTYSEEELNQLSKQRERELNRARQQKEALANKQKTLNLNATNNNIETNI